MNKTLKKTLSIILTILMIALTVPLAFAAGDGVPLTIDVTDAGWVRIGSGYDYYDEDGYIITGTSSNEVTVYEACNLTLKDIMVEAIKFAYADDGSVMNVTLEGTNEVTYYVMLTSEHLIFEGSDDDTFKAPYMDTNGNDGTVTVNGGNIILERVTDGNTPTINCADFIINGGTVTASNNYFYVISGPVKFNGGTLNVISTSESLPAIADDITINKGALLTVSATSGIVRDSNDILKADGLSENDHFFVRYDKESEFAPVYDIKTALEDKTYAEIKIDTHEHTFDDYGICICGYECEHIWRFGECTVCEYVCEHSFTNYTETKAPTCTEAGREVAPCDYCDAMDDNEIPALEHEDTDSDYECDYGCGHEFANPDEPTDTDCSHLCHKTGFMGFIWKIVRVFIKLFKAQQYCECGVTHW